MKKYILAAIVLLACVVNAANNTPWDGKGNPNWNKPNKGLADTYHSATRPGSNGVTFDYSWGSAHKNQIDYYKRTDTPTGWQYVDGTFEFTSAYVWTDFKSQMDIRTGDLTEEQLGTITEFGYYKIVDNQPTVALPMMKINDDGSETKTSVIFQEGEKIGLYSIIDQGDGTTVAYTTTNVALDGVTNVDDRVFKTIYPNVDTDSRGMATQYFCLFDDRGIDAHSHFEYYLGGILAIEEGQSYEDFIDKVIDQNEGNTTITDSNGNAVGGQPLPGLLLSMVIGGTAVAGIAKKRKKA